VAPDLVHVNDSVMLASGAVAARSGVPVVWHLRSSLAHRGRDRRSHWICSALDRFGAAAIAIDDDVASTFRLAIPLRVIRNAPFLGDSLTAELHLPKPQVTVGYFGFLRRQKGWPELLGALRILLDRGLDVHGVFVGGFIRTSNSFRGARGWALRAAGIPDEEADFRRTIAELRLQRFVTLVPFVADPTPFMRAVDIVAFPNQGAGLGRPVLEAAALGKPVIASGSIDGAGIIVPGTTGVLVTEHGSEALAGALAPLVSDADLRARLGRAAAVHVASSTPSSVAGETSRVWEQVLARRREGRPSFGCGPLALKR
jgi:glycosyltransferase involved in cell wall biosynthesis